MLGVRAGGYYGPAGAHKRSPQYTYLLRVFIIPATGIFIVTTLKRTARAPGPRRRSARRTVMDSDTLERSTLHRSRVLLGTT